MSAILEQGQLCDAGRLTHVDGSALYPVAIRNRQTSRIAYIVARPGTGNNQREAAIEIVDAEELIRAVLGQRMSVRCQTVDGSHKGLFSPDGRNVSRAERIDLGAAP